MPGRIVALIVVPVSGVLVMVVIARHIVVIVTIVRDRLHHHLLPLPLLIAIAIDGKRWKMIYLQTTLPIWQSRLFTYFLII